jgi:uncharacterized protein
MTVTLEPRISKENLIDICKKYHIRKLSVFGSATRGDLTPESDIDILVTFDAEHIPGLLTVCHIENELTAMLGRKVDLRTPEDLSRYFREQVVRDAVVQL